MKKIIILLAMLLSANAMYSQKVIQNGNTFKVERTVSAKDTVVTKFKWEDSKGNEFPIVMNKSNGRCYIWKKSGKTGKYYKQYMNEEVSKTICKELGITYIPKEPKK